MIRALFLALAVAALLGVDGESDVVPLRTTLASPNASPEPNGTLGFELTLTTSKSVYRFNEPIFVSMTVRNIRASQMILGCPRPPYSNDITIVDGAGNKVARGAAIDSGDPHLLGGPTGVLLAPGGVGTCIPNSNIRFWGFSELPIGSYSITATHFEPHYVHGGLTSSNTVRISVVP
jgi:hypothetical protein